jgi:transcriptional regulator with XRE-family HTH domain
MSISAGQQLRGIRERLGLTLRDVETASSEIARRRGNSEFSIPFSRLSDIETKGIIPSIFRIYSLSAIYRMDHRDLFAAYGIEWDSMVPDLMASEIRRTHKISALDSTSKVDVPVAMDPGFDSRRTTNIGRMIQKWGTVPTSFLQRFAETKHTYGYLGTEDFTMYPLLLPGSFLQIDETKTEVINGLWRSEYKRPIYFIETRESFICSWCNLQHRDELVIQPHPLSSVSARIFHTPQEAEVIGQVVAIAMRLDDWQPVVPNTRERRQERLN